MSPLSPLGECSLISISAEGNPDEEKIGAFGVGQYLGPLTTCVQYLFLLGFYSLFSVTEEPFVTSGGGCSSVAYMLNPEPSHRSMDGLLLEGWKGPGLFRRLSLSTACNPILNNSYLLAEESCLKLNTLSGRALRCLYANLSLHRPLLTLFGSWHRLSRSWPGSPK